MNEIRIGNIIKISGITIIPLERLTITKQSNPNAYWWYGSKDLYAVVICASFGIQAFDAGAQELPVNDLIEELPQLEDILSSYE